MNIYSVGFALYLIVFLLYLYNYLSGGLLACVKGNGASFAADYSQEVYTFCSSVCVNYNSSTKVRVRRYNVTFFGSFNSYVGILPLRQST